MRLLQEELAVIARQLDAASVFVRMQGKGEALPPVAVAQPGTIPDAVERVVVASGGPGMEPAQIKAALKASGFDTSKLDANPGYLYTVIGRLVQRGKLEKGRRGTYRAPARASSPKGETGAVGAPVHS